MNRSMVDTGPQRVRSSTTARLIASNRDGTTARGDRSPSISSVSSSPSATGMSSSPVAHSPSATMPVTITIKDIRRKATFEALRLEIDSFVQAKITKYKAKMAITPKDDDDDDDDDEVDDEVDSDLETDTEDDEEEESVHESVIKRLRFGMKEFNLLTEMLELDSEGWKVKFDLYDGNLRVRVVPGYPHGVATAVFSELVTIWARNPNSVGLAANPLRGNSDADYQYALNRRKSPDSSFTPKSIQCPPAIYQPGTTSPNYAGTPYPTLVFEVSHPNEPWSRLLNDGRNKAFSRDTSIQVLLAFKIYYKHFRALWAKRGARGYGMRICRVTRKFRIDRPTGLAFNIPTNLIFFGCQAIPQHLQNTPFLRIALEDFRSELAPILTN